MAVLRRLGAFLIYSNLFVAFAVACLTFETQLLLFRKLDVRYAAFVFFSTLFLYNFHRVFRLKKRSAGEQGENRHRWIVEKRTLSIAVLFIAAIGLALVTWLYMNQAVIVALLPVALISFGYSIPFIPARGRFIRLRDVPLVKIFLISLVLSIVTVWIPDVYHYDSFGTFYFTPMSNGVLLLFIRRMLFIFAITVPFDIRDMEYDRAGRVVTIPLVMGERTAKLLAEAALVLFIALVIYQWNHDPFLPLEYALIASAVIAGIAVWFSSPRRNEFYYSFCVEGTMVIQALLIFAVGV